MNLDERDLKWIEKHKELIDSRDYLAIFYEAEKLSLGPKLNRSFLEIGITPEELIKGFDEIPKWYFYNCKALTKITIPDTVKVIREDSFCDCSELLSIEIPKEAYYIGVEAFSGCEKLTKVVIPKSMEKIGNDAFRNCIKLKEMIYKGNISDFRDIEIGKYWVKDTPMSFHYVTCNDGALEIKK